jgi:hypothetical protein
MGDDIMALHNADKWQEAIENKIQDDIKKYLEMCNDTRRWGIPVKEIKPFLDDLFRYFELIRDMPVINTGKTLIQHRKSSADEPIPELSQEEQLLEEPLPDEQHEQNKEQVKEDMDFTGAPQPIQNSNRIIQGKDSDLFLRNQIKDYGLRVRHKPKKGEKSKYQLLSEAVELHPDWSKEQLAEHINSNVTYIHLMLPKILRNLKMRDVKP